MVAQHHGQAVLSCLLRWTLQPLLAKLLQCLTAVVILKECNLLLTRNFLYFSLCPLLLYLDGALLRGVWLHLLCCPHGVFIHSHTLTRLPLGISWVEHSQPSQPFSPGQILHLVVISLYSFQSVHISVGWGSQNWAQHFGWV